MIRFLQGDCREVLKGLADAAVHTVVTSPPYYGLRDYQTATWSGGDAAHDHDRVGARNGRGGSGGPGKQTLGAMPSTIPAPFCSCGAVRIDSQIGLEPTPELFVAELVAVFREVWRVLRDDGTFWLNVGDSYNNFRVPKGPGQAVHGRDKLNGKPAPDSGGGGWDGAKEKDLLMIPARLALALQADGWYLRSDIIWHKPNPMPESCTDRPTSSYEHVFLLAKSGHTTFWTHRDKSGTRKRPEPDYRWVNRETQEERAVAPDGWPDATATKRAWRRVNLWEAHDYFYDAEAVREESITNDPRRPYGSKGAWQLDGRPDEQHHGGELRKLQSLSASGSRNLRNVWTIATAPYKESHFATFPPSLVGRCVKAGTSEKGCCPGCGAPWVRRIEKVDTGRTQKVADGWDTGKGGHGTVHRSGREKGRTGVPVTAAKTTGWQPTCDCPLAEAVPCVVLDPFSGAGTTAVVADRMHRDAIGIDLNAAYGDMARERLVKDAGLFADIQSGDV